MMTSRLVAERLGITQRHAVRLAVLLDVPRAGADVGNGIYFDWSLEHIRAAALLLREREAGKGRFTLGQER